MTRKIIFTFRKGEEELVLDDSSFSVTAYEGLESTDYDLLTEENVGYAGERKRRMISKLLSNPYFSPCYYRICIFSTNLLLIFY